jgi:hypothetical protein
MTLSFDGVGNIRSWLSEKGGDLWAVILRERLDLESIIDHVLTGTLYKQKTGVRTFPFIGPVFSARAGRIFFSLSLVPSAPNTPNECPQLWVLKD